MSFIDIFKSNKKFILVHNTVTTFDEIKTVNNINKNIFWCICPNSNIFIENKMPNIENLMQNNANIVIGTDSLASNKNLSIIDELKTIQQHCPKIQLKTLIKWATYNGAKALNQLNYFGNIKIGTSPGLILITNTNSTISLTPNSSIIRLF